MKKQVIPHEAVVKSLHNFASETPVRLTAKFPLKSMWQECSGRSSWKRHIYWVRYTTTWRSATLATSKATVGELILKLQSDWINDWNDIWHIQFDEEIEKIDGESEKKVIWENDPFTSMSRKTLEEKDSYDDYYWDAPTSECENKYSGIKILTIDLDLGCFGSVQYVLNEQDKWEFNKQQELEKQARSEARSKKKILTHRKSKRSIKNFKYAKSKKKSIKKATAKK